MPCFEISSSISWKTESILCLTTNLDWHFIWMLDTESLSDSYWMESKFSSSSDLAERNFFSNNKKISSWKSPFFYCMKWTFELFYSVKKKCPLFGHGKTFWRMLNFISVLNNDRLVFNNSQCSFKIYTKFQLKENKNKYFFNIQRMTLAPCGCILRRPSGYFNSSIILDATWLSLNDSFLSRIMSCNFWLMLLLLLKLSHHYRNELKQHHRVTSKWWLLELINFFVSSF